MKGVLLWAKRLMEASQKYVDSKETVAMDKKEQARPKQKHVNRIVEAQMTVCHV